jgi:biopolymer transport protein TolR
MRPTSNLRVRVPRKLMSDINVVPYIDVMLVLLVIFMTTAPMMTQGLKVDLPQTQSSGIQAKDEPVTLTVKADGSYYINLGSNPKQSTSLKTITHEAGLIKKQKPATLFLVEGDKKVDYGKVVQLMAALQAAGIDKLALVTEPPGN